VKTSGPSGAVVSNGVQSSGTAMSSKVSFCQLHDTWQYIVIHIAAFHNCRYQ